ncbi:MAG: hypothetical protein SVS85_01005 [Candidatus Nanohaloarchaea archaeon]|nr:hypothetical protein [Candidatus Nanohaloarchaea archaeon]
MRRLPELALTALLVTLLSGTVAAGASQSTQRAPTGIQSLEEAKKQGYVPAGPCVPDMGYHYVNPELVDRNLNPARPEILVFEGNSPSSDKVAAEYFVPGALASDAPTLFGQEMKYHSELGGYALHAWFWKHNPEGVFQPFNPAVKACE